MRFIHLADVHLGAVPDRGCPWSSRREEEIWETFRRVIAGIRENPVDLLFIAGDLFHRQPLLRELKEEDYDFYLDLRKYGSTRHSGYGLGFERCVMYLTGMGNIRDVIPFPRTVNNCDL